MTEVVLTHSDPVTPLLTTFLVAPALPLRLCSEESLGLKPGPAQAAATHTSLLSACWTKRYSSMSLSRH